MDSISEFLKLDSEKRANICVVGDMMVDEYYNVKVTRISPEFPTQIMLSKSIKPSYVVAGGAANVCLQMSKWNIWCNLISFYDDNAIQTFMNREFCTDFGTHIFHPDYEVRVPLKRRFYDGNYPLPRWDIEDEDYGMPDDLLNKTKEKLLTRFYNFVRGYPPDIVILSDYGKGLFTNGVAEQIISHCNLAGIPTIVDPKDPPIDRWRDCTYFKPNAFEAVKMTGIPHPNTGIKHGWWSHYDYLSSKYGIRNVIITDGPNAPFIPHMGEGPNIKLVREPEKESVVGAGDCFCAFLAMALARKMDLEKSVEVAWNASSLYIQSKHNKPLMPHEFARWNDPIYSKVVSVEELERIVNYDKCNWIWTNGCFDVMHVGHLKTLEVAKQLGNKVIVGLNTDESVSKLKGPNRPIISFDHRAEQLAHLQYVDFVVPIDSDPTNVIEKIKPNTIIKGEEYQNKEVLGTANMNKWGGKIVFVPMLTGISSTKIIEKMKRG